MTVNTIYQTIMWIVVAAVLARASQLDGTCSAIQPKAARGNALLQIPMTLSSMRKTRPVVVPLDRVTATPGLLDGRHFYVSSISVGLPPQRFQVLFDTSGGLVVLPHRSCKDPVCDKRASLSTLRSSTSIAMNLSGSVIRDEDRRHAAMRDSATVTLATPDLGVGNASGIFVQDRVCLSATSGHPCTRTGILVATRMEEMPFGALPVDGIVGLSLQALSLAPRFSFLDNLFNDARNVLPQFGLMIGSEKGFLYFGGHPIPASAIYWFPVRSPEEGFWQVPIHEVRVGGVVVKDCSQNCTAIVDTSAHRLGVQDLKIHDALTPQRVDGICRGPDLEFDLGGLVVSLGADDYTDASCRAKVGRLDLTHPGVVCFGYTVLRHYYVAFDWKNQAIGFAPVSMTV